MRYKRLVILFFLLFGLSILSTAQQISPAQKAQAFEELQKRGISEEAFRAKMKEKGVDIDNVRPEQLPQLEPVIRQAVAELEAEKKTQQQGPAENPAEGIGEKIQSAEEQLKAQMEQAVDEKATQVAAEHAEEIQNAVEKGATVQEAIGEQLAEAAKEEAPPVKIFGQDIFRNQSIQLYKTVKDVKPPDTYILGIGDNISVSIWGVSSADFTYEINEQGYISPTDLPRIYLKGLSFGQAKSLLQKRFSQYYVFKPEQFALTINSARTITVNIFGEVLNYGSFNISAINTAFNALVAAGGPSDIGSLRNIKLIRDKQTQILDVYQFLFDPKVQNNFFLENNDIIFIPIAERIISIQGAIKRPFKYELTTGENLLTLIDYAGGLSVDAYQKSIQIERYAGDEKILLDIDLQDILNQNKDFELQNGDVVRIRRIPGRLDNYVEISGAVEFPGKYDLTNGMHISDLVAKGLLKKEARTDLAFLLRVMPDKTNRLLQIDVSSVMAQPGSPEDLLLQPKDKLITYEQARFIDLASVSVTGAVRNPVEQAYDPENNIRIYDLLQLAGGLQQDAAQYGYIHRTDLTNPTQKQYIRVDVRAAFADPSSPENIVMQPADALLVYDRTRFSDAADVLVSGALRYPGNFDYDQSLRLSDVIYLAGGLTRDAMDFGYLVHSDFNNPKLREYQRVNVKAAMENPGSAEDVFLLPFDRLEVMSITTFTDVFMVEVAGEVRNPGQFEYAETLTLHDVLTMAGGLKLEADANRIDVFRLEIKDNQPTQTLVNTLQVNYDYNAVNNTDFQLQPFDKIVVRTVPDFELLQTVTLHGEVKYPGTYALLSKNEQLSSVINRAGGLTVEAFPKGAQLYRVEDNTGNIISRLDKALRNQRSRYNYVLKNGDVITIPKAQDLVSINLGGTLASILYPEKMLTGGKLTVAHKGGKRAGWYIRHYAAGIDRDKRARKSLVSVRYSNGELRRSHSILFYHYTPKVRKGSVISVGIKPEKPPKPEKEKQERKPVDWNRIISDVFALTASSLTILVLAKQL